MSRKMILRSTPCLLVLLLLPVQLIAQLRIGSSQAEINFREGPGMGSKVLFTISSSNLLVFLPVESKNGFAEVFDVESNSFGYVYESLIKVTDTLKFQKQNYFERSAVSEKGDLDICLINRTGYALFVWINKFIYHLDPHEKKDLVLDSEDIIYFSSSPGLFPVFGRETLKKGFRYIWNFTI